MSYPSISLADARRLADAAQAKAAQLGVLVAVTVVDVGGNPVLFERMDLSQLASATISRGKAYTAVSWQRESGDLWAIAQPGEGGFGIESIDARFVLSPGGVPILRDGALVGAVGVSGATGEQDRECALAALAAL